MWIVWLLLIISAGNCSISYWVSNMFSDERFWSAAIGISRMSSCSCFASRSIFDQTFCVAFFSICSVSYSYR